MKLNSCKPKKGSSKSINPSTHQFSSDSEEWHFISNSRPDNKYILLDFSLCLVSKRCEVQKLTYLCTNTQLLAMHGLSCGHDKILVLYLWIIANNFMRFIIIPWYQDAPLHHLFVYQISRQSDNKFPLYSTFNIFTEKRKKHRN